MKKWHSGLLAVGALLVTTALSLASRKEAEPLERTPSPPVIYRGPVTSVYWLEHGNTARGYASTAEDHGAPKSLNVIGGIAKTITGRVYEGWVVIDVDREVVLVPREKVISLRFEHRKD